jgi:hypothetical protein
VEALRGVERLLDVVLGLPVDKELELVLEVVSIDIAVVGAEDDDKDDEEEDVETIESEVPPAVGDEIGSVVWSPESVDVTTLDEESVIIELATL